MVGSGENESVNNLSSRSRKSACLQKPGLQMKMFETKGV